MIVAERLLSTVVNAQEQFVGQEGAVGRIDRIEKPLAWPLQGISRLRREVREATRKDGERRWSSRRLSDISPTSASAGGAITGLGQAQGRVLHKRIAQHVAYPHVRILHSPIVL